MKKKNIFQMILEKIKSAFLQTNGIMLPHETNLPKEVSEFQEEVMSDLSMKHLSEDKLNLRKDAEKIKSDFNKAFNEYNSHVCTY